MITLPGISVRRVRHRLTRRPRGSSVCLFLGAWARFSENYFEGLISQRVHAAQPDPGQRCREAIAESRVLVTTVRRPLGNLTLSRDTQSAGECRRPRQE